MRDDEQRMRALWTPVGAALEEEGRRLPPKSARLLEHPGRPASLLRAAAGWSATWHVHGHVHLYLRGVKGSKV